MKKRSVQILFIVSLAFNLAFISLGTFRFIQMRKFADPQARFRHFPQETKDLFRRFRNEIDPIRKEIEEVRHDFIAELRNPDYNEEYLKEKLDHYLEKQAELERTMGYNFIEIRKNLTPEQIEKFFSHMPQDKHHQFPKRQFPPFMKKKPLEQRN